MKLSYDALKETMEMRTLPNGMAVYFIPKPLFTRSFAILATNFGSVDKSFSIEGKRYDTPVGVAHFLEHKMFEDEDGNALQKFARTGASPNAYTSRTMTAYHFTCDEAFEENLKILLKFVFTPYFTEENVAKERGIIEQEIDMIEDTPGWRVYNGLLRGLYHEHPARESIAGSAASIAEITPELLYTCHKAFYSPSNMALVVCGDSEMETICRLAQQHSPKTATAIGKRFYGTRQQGVCEEFVREQMPVSQPMFMAGFKDAPVAAGESRLRRMLIGELAVQVLCGESTPFYNSLYQGGLISGYLESDYAIMPEGAYASMGGEAKNPLTVYERLRVEVKRLASGAIDPLLFTRTKRAQYGLHIRMLDSQDELARAQVSAAFAGEYYMDFAALYETIEPTDLQQMYARWAQTDRSTLSVVEPFQKEGK